jgi:hypothetical protein
MSRATCGFLQSPYCTPGKSAVREYESYCRDHGLPTVTITRPQYWKVEVSARTMPGGRFPREVVQWLRESANALPRVHRYPIVSPARAVVYGLTIEQAHQFAGEVLDAFPALRGFTWYPLDELMQTRPEQARQSAPPTPPPSTARTSLLDRVRGGTPNNVVDLTMYRARRRLRHHNGEGPA